MRTARRETSCLRVQVLVIGENKEIWTERPEGRQIRLTAIGHVLPVYRNDELIGDVGGSGGTNQQDEDCAQSRINAL